VELLSSSNTQDVHIVYLRMDIREELKHLRFSRSCAKDVAHVQMSPRAANHDAILFPPLSAALVRTTSWLASSHKNPRSYKSTTAHMNQLASVSSPILCNNNQLVASLHQYHHNTVDCQRHQSQSSHRFVNTAHSFTRAMETVFLVASTATLRILPGLW
jgi:hypothetical protein